MREGYLPDALVSFIATLGWNDGSTQEVFNRDELIDKFKLSRVGKSGAHFDERRLQWTNGHFIRDMKIEALYEATANFWPNEAKSATDEYKKAVLGLVQERLKFFGELPELTKFFFVDLPADISLITNHKQLKKLDAGEATSLLKTVESELEQSDFSVEDLTNRLNALLQKTAQKPAVLFSLVRVVTTWSPASPGLAETLSVLGKEKSMTRIRASYDKITW